MDYSFWALETYAKIILIFIVVYHRKVRNVNIVSTELEFCGLKQTFIYAMMIKRNKCCK